MPKPGKYNNPPWKKQYNNDYDARVNNTDNTRRVTFKHNRHGKKGKQKDWTNSIRAHLEDEDVDMGTTSFDRQKKIYNNRRGGRHGSPIPDRMGPKRKLLESPSNWFRVTLPYGNKYDKAFILRSILERVTPIPFLPVAWSVNGVVATFYVDDYKLADKLHSLDRQIQCPDGFKLLIRVHSGSPNVDVTDALKQKLKVTMAKRYNAANKALDLTKFHADPDLQDVFCALFKPIILLTVIDIISENIPELEALNLNENRIQMLNHLRKLDKKLPNLKVLHLGNNKIREITSLDPLMGLPVVDLVLDGNPLCARFREQTAYVSEVRKRFPKVIKLDGIDLPPPIGFDIAEEVHLPTSVQTYLCNAEGQEIVRQFLEQYFEIFDSGSRQPLLQAYHENAMFSLTSSYAYGQTPKNSSWLNWYNTDNRNLLRVQDHDRRNKLLRQGQLTIVSFLSEMPESKHDIHSFTVDLNLFTPQLLLLTVSGIFKELRSGHKSTPIRHFCRTLVIVPAGSGFCIANEQLHITNATEQQTKLAFKTPIIAVTQPTPELNVNASPVVPVPIPPMIDDNTKQQMIQTMSQQSGMNIEWSQKCLVETNWDFNRAAFIFTELQKQGTIPAEAFVKYLIVDLVQNITLLDFAKKRVKMGGGNSIFQLPEDICESLICSKCGAYLSCGPVHLLEGDKYICGRCPVETELPQILYDQVMEKISFPCRSSALYYVVEFPDEENNGITPLSVVSYKWLGGANQCFWPGRAKADKERMKMVENHSSPKKDHTWTLIRINVKYKSVSYERAVEKMNTLECVSSVTQSNESDESNAPKRRARRPRSIYEDYINNISSDNSEDIPVIRLPKQKAKRLSEDIYQFENTNRFLASPREESGPKSCNLKKPKFLDMNCVNSYANRDLINEDPFSMYTETNKIVYSQSSATRQNSLFQENDGNPRTRINLPEYDINRNSRRPQTHASRFDEIRANADEGGAK
ncbi:hypothetical protein RN001_014086 [Aquatica leii]|uniref:Nuclear RNA export factor 1 n=1 Tax=Aquatica leii TaxID=1421715 RepID=A0AAN7S7C3_9COLE|nr:hypothetical protein RN001_014086 [Aquatica leii]